MLTSQIPAPKLTQQQLSAMGVRCASSKSEREKLSSGIKVLDAFFDGGLARGTVSEWGLPMGRGGRELVVAWLAAATRGLSQLPQLPQLSSQESQWVLWISSRSQLTAYPPAWLARGVALERIRFAVCDKPLAELRPVFMEPFFKIIVIDAPRFFSEEDCAFIARQARAQGQIVLLLREHFLSASRGNVWTPLRVNAWYDETVQRFRLQAVRGLSPRQMTLAPGEAKCML